MTSAGDVTASYCAALRPWRIGSMSIGHGPRRVLKVCAPRAAQLTQNLLVLGDILGKPWSM